ncbi:hypothetical protein COMA2_20028 [Candidatus Nitrospira nitrificans]|uniref:Uncharacterized protein n=1 Tax=Candidatus Nitrospira nitrificans TaxID=1742973 RepID=A0A0S4LE90_9BACT|nr:hypothetical protein COMA2_20028 [Candidatus Nitrospira nitrificans]
MPSSAAITRVSARRTQTHIAFSRRKKLVLTEGVLIDPVCPTVSLCVHVAWVSRAIWARISFRFSSWNWRAGRKWTGARTFASRRWMRELSRAG